MHAIKNLFAKYSAWIWKVLAPLGPWGVLAIAAVDGSFLGMPVDAVVAGYVYYHRATFWFCVLMASAGSAIGSLVVYAIGRGGGELLLEKKMSRGRYERIRARFDEHEFLALMLPAILPPPAPFKLVVLSAAAFGMNWRRFMMAIFMGRVVRFGALALLVLFFGPQIASYLGVLLRQHLAATVIALTILVVLIVLSAKWNKRRRRSDYPAAGQPEQAGL